MIILLCLWSALAWATPEATTDPAPGTWTPAPLSAEEQAELDAEDAPEANLDSPEPIQPVDDVHHTMPDLGGDPGPQLSPSVPAAQAPTPVPASQHTPSDPPPKSAPPVGDSTPQEAPVASPGVPQPKPMWQSDNGGLGFSYLPAAVTGPAQSTTMVEVRAADSPWTSLLPALESKGPGSAIWAFLLAGALLLVAGQLDRARRALRPQGLLPRVLTLLTFVGRLIGLGVAISGLAALVPAQLEGVLPIAVVAVAAAIGWSTRDLLPDLISGAFLAIEGQLLPGQWLQTPEGSGTVERTGLRVTWLRTSDGRLVRVPNRVLLDSAVVTDSNPHPQVTIDLVLPTTLSVDQVHRWLGDLARVSPWVAPESDPTVSVGSDGYFKLTVRLLDGRYEDRFVRTLRGQLAALTYDAEHPEATAEASTPDD